LEFIRKHAGRDVASARLPLRSVSTTELIILALLLFALPLFEAPKNIFSGLLIIAYLVRSAMLRDFGRASPFEIPIWVLLALTLIAPLTSEYAGQLGLLESAQWWLVIGLTAIVAGRLDYTPSQLRILLAAVILGGVWAVVDSLWVWSLNGKTYPEFRSVGHVNPSALYMLNVLAAGFAALLSDKRWMQAIGAAGIVAAFAYFFPARSLVAMASALVVTTLGLIIVLKDRFSARAIWGSAFAVLIAFMALLATPPAAEFRNELVTRITTGGFFGEGDTFLSHRDSLFFTALEVYDRNPLFGTGLRSFHIATDPEVVRAELEAEGRDFDAEADRFFWSSHGHNLWTTTLIERGLVGVVTVTVFLVMVFAVFTRPAFAGAGVPSDQKLAATLGFLTVTYITFAGLGQTTTYVEHGQTGMILLSVAWGALAAARADATTP
jgi:O-antigen ligase